MLTPAQPSLMAPTMMSPSASTMTASSSASSSSMNALKHYRPIVSPHPLPVVPSLRGHSTLTSSTVNSLPAKSAPSSPKGPADGANRNRRGSTITALLPTRRSSSSINSAPTTPVHHSPGSPQQMPRPQLARSAQTGEILIHAHQHSKQVLTTYLTDPIGGRLSEKAAGKRPQVAHEPHPPNTLASNRTTAPDHFIIGRASNTVSASPALPANGADSSEMRTMVPMQRKPPKSPSTRKAVPLLEHDETSAPPLPLRKALSVPAGDKEEVYSPASVLRRLSVDSLEARGLREESHSGNTSPALRPVDWTTILGSTSQDFDQSDTITLPAALGALLDSLPQLDEERSESAFSSDSVRDLRAADDTADSDGASTPDDDEIGLGITSLGGGDFFDDLDDEEEDDMPRRPSGPWHRSATLPSRSSDRDLRQGRLASDASTVLAPSRARAQPPAIRTPQLEAAGEPAPSALGLIPGPPAGHTYEIPQMAYSDDLTRQPSDSWSDSTGGSLEPANGSLPSLVHGGHSSDSVGAMPRSPLAIASSPTSSIGGPPPLVADMASSPRTVSDFGSPMSAHLNLDAAQRPKPALKIRRKPVPSPLIITQDLPLSPTVATLSRNLAMQSPADGGADYLNSPVEFTSKRYDADTIKRFALYSTEDVAISRHLLPLRTLRAAISAWTRREIAQQGMSCFATVPVICALPH